MTTADRTLTIEIDELRRLMGRLATDRGVPEPAVDLVVDHFLDGELRGKYTHGVSKFLYESQFFADRIGAPFLIVDRGAVAIVDGNKEIGPIAARYAVDVVGTRARTFGIGLVGLRNSQRIGTLGYWTEAMAAQGLFGVVMNTTMPDCTIDGCVEALVGVNPISFAAPTTADPIVGDLATSIAPMGLLWEARRGHGRIPANAFIDAAGRCTDDPDAATLALVFGGYKGFAVSTMIELLAGPAIGVAIDEPIQSPYDAGFLFIAVDPTVTAPGADVRAANTRLRNTVESKRDRDGATLRLCGTRSAASRSSHLARGQLDLPAWIVSRLRGLESV